MDYHKPLLYIQQQRYNFLVDVKDHRHIDTKVYLRDGRVIAGNPHQCKWF